MMVMMPVDGFRGNIEGFVEKISPIPPSRCSPGSKCHFPLIHVTYRVLSCMLLGSLHVLLCCCRPLDDTEDTDPDLMEDGEMVADSDSEEECDDAERDVDD